LSSFSEVLQQLGGGQVYQDLGDKLTEAVQAVQETRKIGEVTLRLKIKPNGEYGVMIADEVKVKVPERPRGETLFFVNAAGHLMRNDPRQEQLPLRRIEAGMTSPLRTVSDAEVVNG
jgi:hypothetical protein